MQYCHVFALVYCCAFGHSVWFVCVLFSKSAKLSFGNVTTLYNSLYSHFPLSFDINAVINGDTAQQA